MSIEQDRIDEQTIAPTQELTGEDREQFLQDAHDMIDWLQANPGVPIARWAAWSCDVYDSWVEADTDWDSENNRRMPIVNRVFTPAVVARAMRKADKHAGGSSFRLERRFGNHAYSYAMPRDEVCTPTVTGQREVIRRVPTDEDRIKELKAQIEALHVEQPVMEDVIEYDCPGSLLAGDKS